MKITRKGLPLHQIVIFVHLTVIHYFYFIFDKNYCLNKIYHIFKMLQCFGQKSFYNTENQSDPPPSAEFRPPNTKSWIRPRLYLLTNIYYQYPTSLARHILYEHVVYVLFTLISRQLLLFV